MVDHILSHQLPGDIIAGDLVDVLSEFDYGTLEQLVLF